MSANIFIPSTKKNSAGESIQEDVEFVFWKNPKTGQDFKLLNLENDALAPREGLIELRPKKITARHDNNVGFGLLNDKEYDCYLGIPVTFDHESGKPIWQKITLSNYEVYNLAIKSQRQEWIIVSRCPYYTDVINGVEQNPNFDSGMKAQYKAIDKEREADQFARMRQVKRKAEDIAEALLDYPKELEETALMCGLDPKAMSKQRLWAEVVKYAESKPEEFMKIYKSDTKVELAVLRRGLLTGVLHESLSEGTNFNGLTLGHTQEQCLAYLKEHPQTLASIDALSRKTDKETLASNPAKNSITESNAKEIALANKVKELEARLAAVSETKIEELSGNILDKIDPEYSTLLAEAKRLNVKGAHLVKDKEKLRAKIEEASKLKKN